MALIQRELICGLVCFVLVLICATVDYNAGVDAAWCNMKSNQTGPMNLNPVDISNPVFVRRVKNAELYYIGSNIDDRISLVHLYGSTGYDWGYGYGQLMAKEIEATLAGFWETIVAQAESALNGTADDYDLHFPEWFLKAMATIGIEAALDLQNAFAEEFMLDSWYDEMRGMADATGISYSRIVQVHMLGEITRGRCSFYGAYGAATKDGHVLQLRALDWSMDTGIQDHPVVVIYHPESPHLGVPFANIGWAGVVETLTGVSSAQIGISEIGIAYPDDTFGDESMIGIPFLFLERQIIQFGKGGIDTAIKMISNAERTCRLVLGIADGVHNTSVLVQYSHSIVRFLNDSTLEPNEWWHQRIPDVVYCAMDWICPYYQNLMQNQIHTLYGSLTPELSIMNITAPVQTGSLHTAVYDLTSMLLYVANARGSQDNPSGPVNAYSRQFVRFDLNSLFIKKYGQN